MGTRGGPHCDGACLCRELRNGVVARLARKRCQIWAHNFAQTLFRLAPPPGLEVQGADPPGSCVQCGPSDRDKCENCAEISYSRAYTPLSEIVSALICMCVLYRRKRSAIPLDSAHGCLHSSSRPVDPVESRLVRDHFQPHPPDPRRVAGVGRTRTCLDLRDRYRPRATAAGLSASGLVGDPDRGWLASVSSGAGYNGLSP